MINILSDKKADCCGCMACKQICPVHCITAAADEEGFCYPAVCKEKCIRCGACERVCPVINRLHSTESAEDSIPMTLGGWHKDEKIRYESSSGGAFTLFAESVISHGGIVYGCALNSKMEAVHTGVERIEELGRLRGSKYVQSRIEGTYAEIREHLKNGRQVMFVGTPCQTAGLYSFMGREQCDKLLLCDFICHGVPSPSVFRDYILRLEKQYQGRIVSFRFRNKDKGWSGSGLQMGTDIVFADGRNIRLYPAYKDIFMNGFLDDAYLRPSCYHCAFKEMPKKYSDITIADFWGVDRVDSSLNDKKGTSLMLLHSEKGINAFHDVEKNFSYRYVEYGKAVKRNRALTESAERKPRRDAFFTNYSHGLSDQVIRRYMSAEMWILHKCGSAALNMMKTFVRTVLGGILGKFHIRLTDRQWENIFQFMKFGIVGVSNSVVSYCINILVLTVLKPAGFRYDYIVANVTAFLLAVLWSYMWNHKYVFTLQKGETRSTLKTLAKTYLSYGFSGLILNNVLSTVWIHVLGVSKYLSPLLNLPFSIPVNFLMNKLWAYKGESENQKI